MGKNLKWIDRLKFNKLHNTQALTIQKKNTFEMDSLIAKYLFVISPASEIGAS